MFGVLLESNPRRQGRRGVAAASVAVHAGMILLGVWATAESSDPVTQEQREQLVPTIYRNAEPVPARRQPAGPVRQSETTVEVPAVPPIIPSVPPITVPDGLPTVEETLGDPFARRTEVTSEVVNGIGRGSEPGTVFDNLVAEKPALPLESNEPPAYPAMLRSAAIEGTVEIEFIIDPNGRVRPGSIVPLRADHARFLDAVREALADYRYLPAEVGGKAVAVRVRQRFAFQLDG